MRPSEKKKEKKEGSRWRLHGDFEARFWFAPWKGLRDRSRNDHQVPKRTLIGQYAMSGNCDLFGEPEVHCCCSVDNSRTNVTSVRRCVNHLHNVSNNAQLSKGIASMINLSKHLLTNEILWSITVRKSCVNYRLRKLINK